MRHGKTDDVHLGSAKRHGASTIDRPLTNARFGQPAIMAGSETIRFGSFCLIPAERTLLCGGVLVELRSRAFDLLLALVRRNGGLATKDELMAEVWPHAVVEENNLQAQVSALRKALVRDAGGSGYLLTVAGHGYRFVAEVTRESASDAVSQADPSRPVAATLEKPSLAILPFQNMSRDPEQEYFAEAWWRRSSLRCRVCGGCSSSPAIRVFPSTLAP